MNRFFYLFQKTVDRLVKQGTLALVVGTSSWKEQFVEAITVSAGTLFYIPFAFQIFSF